MTPMDIIGLLAMGYALGAFTGWVIADSGRRR